MSKPVYEKCCSRCWRVNWDATTGLYRETCTDDKPCDTNGTQYDEDGNTI